MPNANPPPSLAPSVGLPLDKPVVLVVMGVSGRGKTTVAVLLAVLLAMVTFGTAVGVSLATLAKKIGASLAPIVGVMLILGAGGGFAAGLSPNHITLAVLAVGAGSLINSHVNDAGFWLVKGYFGLTVGQTLKTWSLMETFISVIGLGLVVLLSTVL
jgi:GntP family gluconate:H+ symporter